MFHRVIYKPRPRCLRDKLELWFLYRNGMCVRFNLAGLIPYLGVPVGLIIGAIVSLMMFPGPEISWGDAARYTPILLGAALGVLLGVMVRYAIIGEYYRHPLPERDEQALDRILEEMRQEKRGGGKKPSSQRRKRVED